MQFNGGVYNSDIWREKFRDGLYYRMNKISRRAIQVRSRADHDPDSDIRVSHLKFGSLD